MSSISSCCKMFSRSKRVKAYSAVCCYLLTITQAYPSGSGHKLVAFPDLSDFSHISYPHLDVIDLGDTQKYVPEKEIKVVRTIKITEPYPVKVPVKVPYPVPVIKEVPIEVTKVVKVPEPPVHVDVVKSVQVHSSATADHVHRSVPGNLVQEHWQPSAFANSPHLDSQSQGSNEEYQPNIYPSQENYELNKSNQ